MKNIEQFPKNFNNKEKDYFVLRDMFKKCLAQRDLSNEQDELLDVTATLLIKIHKDKSILPIIVDIIFFRNREGLFNHNLIWAFFEARDPYSLMLIANYLGSENVNDVELACKLLDFVPSIGMNNEKDSENQYTTFFYWLYENYPFLCFTGESFQRSSKPIPYMVILDAKYLCKRVSLYTGKPFTPFTRKENSIIGCFNNLDEDKKQLLSKFSLRIQAENIYQWDSWINHSITKQISIAEARLRS